MIKTQEYEMRLKECGLTTLDIRRLRRDQIKLGVQTVELVRKY